MKANHIYLNLHAFENNSVINKFTPSKKKIFHQKYTLSKKLHKKITQKHSLLSADQKLKKKSITTLNSKTKHKKEVKYSTFNIEDSSTNCLSRSNFKSNYAKKNTIKELLNSKIEFNIPFLLPTVSETESQFINTKLGEKDSLDISLSKISNEKSFLQKSKKDDSCEIYDFNDETHVDYVLNNFSMLSYSHSNQDKSSTMLEDCNDDELNGNKNVINKVKIFNTKHSKENFMNTAMMNFHEI